MNKISILQCLVIENVSVLGRLKEFPRAKPKGTLEGGGLYLTAYPELSTNMDSISFNNH